MGSGGRAFARRGPLWSWGAEFRDPTDVRVSRLAHDEQRRGCVGVWRGRREENPVEIARRTRLGRVLALGVVPALVVAVVLGPQIWVLLTAGIDLPVPVGSLATGAAVIWLVAALVCWVALWLAGRDGHPNDERGRGGRVAAGAIVAVLLLAATIAGNALSEAGWGDGREKIVDALVPLGGARARYSEDDLKDLCHAQYMTTAAPDDVFAHHGAQLTAQGWRVRPPDPTIVPPYLEARRGDLSVHVSVDRIDGENLVQLLASRSG